MAKNRTRHFIPRKINKRVPNTLRSRLLAGMTPGEIIAQTRRDDDPAEFAHAISWVHSRPTAALIVFPSDFPKTLSELRPDRIVVAEMSADREIAWACARLLPYAEKLASFTAISTLFGQARLVDNFAECLVQLDEVRRNFGWSQWLVRSQIAYLQARHGLEPHKLWVAEALKNGVSSFTALSIHYASLCNEPSQTPARNFLQFEQWVRNQPYPASLKGFLWYTLSRHILGGPAAIAGVLNYEGASSVIDLYEAIIATGQSLAADSSIPLARAYLRWTEPLAQLVPDQRLQMIRTTLGAEVDLPNVHPKAITCFEQLVEGKVDQAYRTAATVLCDSLAQCDAMETAAWAIAYGANPHLSNNHLVDRLVARMASVALRSEGSADDVQELIRTATAFAGQPWAEGILGFVERETSADPLGAGPASLRAAAVTAPIHPLRVERLRLQEVRKSYYARVASLGPGSALYAGTAFLPPMVSETGAYPSPEMLSLIALRNALHTGNHNGALEAANALVSSGKAPFRHWGVRASAHCLLVSGRLQDALHVIVTRAVIDPSAHEILPLRPAASCLTRNARATLASDLAVPILFDLFSRHVGPDHDSDRAYATEDLLEAYKVDRPSALGGITEIFDRQQLIYFLRHVCVEVVLESLLSLDGSRAVREERVEICRLLVQLDPVDADSYKAEIKDLLRRLVVQRRMREVEQSKIHVDVDGVRRVADTTLRETFNRITAYLQAGLDISRILQVEQVIRQALGENTVLVFPSPMGEPRNLLTALIQQLRDLYVASPEYGLDKYLSVRIRHQTLAGHLRKPLDEKSLITQMEKATDRYSPNRYWLGRLGTNEESTKLLGDAFEDFARGFDGLVAEIRDSWIQIRTEAEDRGLFDFVVDDAIVQRIAQSIGPETTFEQFLDTALAFFGAKLDSNLKEVRTRLAGEAANRLNQLFADLSASVEALSLRLYTGELAKAIRDAHTSMQYALQRVTEWFRRARTVANEPFDVEDAVHIGEEIVRTTPRPLPIGEIRTMGERVQLPGEFFNDYVDILTTIFGNVITYADPLSPELEVSVSFQEGGVRVRVENSVAESFRDDSARERVAHIKSDIKDGQFRRVASEGGTGFYKIGKILDGLGSQSTLGFGFVANDRFAVEFKTPAALRAS